jgi:hypothetical protein
MDLVLHSRGIKQTARFPIQKVARNHLTRCFAGAKDPGSKVVQFLLSFFEGTWF